MTDQIYNLILQEEFGIDETISTVPINRMQPSSNISASSHEGIEEGLSKNNNVVDFNSSIEPVSNINNIPAVASSIEMASKCNSLEDLRESVNNIENLSIKKTATNTVFADGNSESNIMFIGEAPGSEEDKQAIPFCGASGKLLDKSLSYIGLNREENFYITNTVFWRPPGNRRPTNEELAICRPFVEKHISLLKPKLIVLVGGIAVFSLLSEEKKITKVRGQYFKYSNDYLENDLNITSVFHPSYLLRQPSQKKLFWQDLLKIRAFLDEK